MSVVEGEGMTVL